MAVSLGCQVWGARKPQGKVYGVQVKHGVDIPDPLWRQIGSDWSDAAAAALKTFVAQVPHDLEHLYRNCRKNVGRHPLGRPLSVWYRIVRAAAFAPTGLMASLLLRKGGGDGRSGRGGSRASQTSRGSFLGGRPCRRPRCLDARGNGVQCPLSVYRSSS